MHTPCVQVFSDYGMKLEATVKHGWESCELTLDPQEGKQVLVTTDRLSNLTTSFWTYHSGFKL